MNKLIIFGTGGLAIELFNLIKEQTKDNEIYFFNNVDKIDKFLDCSVLNNLDYFYKSFSLIAVSNPFLRKKFYDNYKEYLFFDFFISKNSFVYNSDINEGTIITDSCIIYPCKIGSNNYININSTIGAETIICNNNYIAPNVSISGRVIIGNNIYIGSKTFIRQDIKICDNVIIGSCSNVTKDIKIPGIYYGNPCKFIKENKYDYKDNIG